MKGTVLSNNAELPIPSVFTAKIDFCRCRYQFSVSEDQSPRDLMGKLEAQIAKVLDGAVAANRDNFGLYCTARFFRSSHQCREVTNAVGLNISKGESAIPIGGDFSTIPFVSGTEAASAARSWQESYNDSGNRFALGYNTAGDCRALGQGDCVHGVAGWQTIDNYFSESSAFNLQNKTQIAFIADDEKFTARVGHIESGSRAFRILVDSRLRETEGSYHRSCHRFALCIDHLIAKNSIPGKQFWLEIQFHIQRALMRIDIRDNFG